MALKSLVNRASVVPQVGGGRISEKPSYSACFGLKNDGFIGNSANFVIRAAAGEPPSPIDESESSLTKKLQKDLISLPSKLSYAFIDSS